MTWNFISSIVSSDRAGDLVFSGGGKTRPLTIVRRSSVRGMRLAVDPRDASVRLTMPKRSALRPALAWVAGKRDWVEAELARLPSPQPIVPGMRFLLAGDEVVLDWQATSPRRVRLEAGRLLAGGPLEQLPGRVLRFVKAYALATLADETRMLGQRQAIGIGRVGVGDPKSRWGSCSTSGDIRYSWRLILAPGHARRATVAHEVAHRVHMNHGQDFHALVERISDANPSAARAWLRANGTKLHWFGRDG